MTREHRLWLDDEELRQAELDAAEFREWWESLDTEADAQEAAMLADDEARRERQARADWPLVTEGGTDEYPY